MAGTDLYPVRENIPPIPSLQPIGSTQANLSVASPYEASAKRKDDFYPSANNTQDIAKTVTSQELFDARKFPSFNPEKTEEDYAYGQTTFEKAKNGLGKMVGLTGMTIANNTAGLLYGVTAAIGNQNFSSLYDNDWSKAMDESSKRMEEIMPHYYTDAERDSPLALSSIFSGNFFWDKIVKNIGFMAGTAVTAYGASALAEAMSLSKGLVSAGKWAQALEATEAGVAEAKGLAGVVNALKSAGTKVATKFGAAVEGLGTVNTGAKFSPGNLAISSFLSSTGESSVEAFQNKTDYYNNAVAEYTKNNGVAPEGGDLEQIKIEADHVGNFTFGLNMALLTISNNYQLPKIFGSTYSGEKKVINDAVFNNGLWQSALPTSKFGKLTYGAYKGLGLLFNKTEAFEEGAQYAIQAGTSNFFAKGKDKAGYNTLATLQNLAGVLTPGGAGVLGKGVEKTLTSDEGLESMLIGGLSGALMTSGITTFGQTGEIKERGLFGYGGEKGKVREQSIKAWNNSPFSSRLKEFTDAINRSEVLNDEREFLIRQGDVLESKDVEADYMLNTIMPRIKYGGIDAISEEIEDSRQQALTTDGFLALQEKGTADKNDTPETFLARLNNIESVAKSVQKNYNKFQTLFGGIPLTDADNKIVLDSNGKPQRKYSDDAINRLVYASAKINDYTKRISDLSSTISDKGIDITNLLESTDKTGKIDKELKDKAIADVMKLGLTTDVTTELVENIKDASELSARKKLYSSEFNDIITAPEKYKEAKPVAPKKEGEAPKTILIKTKKGEKEIEIGTEYYLGRVTEYDENRNEVYRMPKLTILGENEDGTIRIQPSSGPARNISKEDLLDYNLGKVSDTDTNRKANFMLKHWNTVFEHYGIKDKNGKPVKGRIEYSDKENSLIFAYRDAKGEVKRVPVSNKLFATKEGYNHPMINPIGELVADQQQATKDLIGEKENLSSKIKTRNKIILDLYRSSKARLEEVNKTIEGNKNKLETIATELNDIQKTKKGEPRKVTKALKKSINTLSKLREDIEKEIINLQAEKEEIEAVLPYVQEFYENRDQLPEAGSELLQQLKKDVNGLEELIDITNDAIKSNDTLLKDVDKALVDALAIFNDYVRRLKEENPNVPLFLQELQDRLEKYQGEEGAKQFIQQKLGFTELVIQLESDIADFADELKVPILSKKADDLVNEIKELQKGLDGIVNEQLAKQKILDTFQEFADKDKLQKEEEARIQKNAALVNALIGTLEIGLPNTPYNADYKEDPKKDDQDVILGTTAPTEEFSKAPLAPHHVRANEFGFKLPSLPNANEIHGVIVTSKNEAELGVPGLTQFLKDEGDTSLDVDTDKTIALVMVSKNPKTGKIQLVDVNGNPIANKKKGESQDAYKNRVLNSTIYQVFPLTLSWSDSNSMFRSTTPKNVVKSLTEQHSAWRAEVLANPSLHPHKIRASFGIAQRESTVNEHGVKEPIPGKSTSAEGAGLITTSDLTKDPLVVIPTTAGTLSKGSTSFSNPVGRIFLSLKNAYVKLKNRKLNEKEAETIFAVIYKMSKNAFEDRSLKTQDTPRLLNWLKSIVYWGTPMDANKKRKPAGYNSLFVEREDGVLKLFISGKGQSYVFTPTNLEENKDEIITLLQGMYNNVNATTVSKDWNDAYEEITGVNEDGSLEVTDWNNYQEYLLSPKGRKAEELPLSVEMRPKENKEDVNRSGIYFTIADQDDIDRFEIPAASTRPVIITPGGPKKVSAEDQFAPTSRAGQQAPQAPQAAVGITFDGESLSEMPLNDKEGNFVGNLQFVASPEGEMLRIQDEEIDKKNQELLDKLVDILGVPKDSLIARIKEKVKEQLPTSTTEDQFKPTSRPTTKKAVEVAEAITTTPISQTDADEFNQAAEQAPDNELHRIKLVEDIKQFESEDWTKIEKWLKNTFPNVPVYRVKNILKTTNGLEAWGMFKDGAIYVYENAEVGTIYHEVFESVWKMFTPLEEQQGILNEFKARKGTFVDRETRKETSYSDATPHQIKEQLAEEFRDYVLFKKIPAKPTQGRPFIVKLFSDLVNFIKEFFTGNKAQTNTANLFDKIGSGYFKQSISNYNALSFAEKGIIDIDNITPTAGSEYRLKNIRESQTHDIVQQMIYDTISELSKSNKSLFTIQKLNKTDLYNRLYNNVVTYISQTKRLADQSVALDQITQEEADEKIAKALALFVDVKNQWKEITGIYEDSIKAYSIDFDEEDNVITRDEDNSGKETYQDASRIDTFKKANAAIKLLLASIPRTTKGKDGQVDSVPSSINGKVLLPQTQVQTRLLNKISSSRNVNEMLEGIREIALEDSDYIVLYKRLSKNNNINEEADLTDTLTEMHDVQLISALWKTFKKQDPDVKNIYILDNGDIVVGDSNFSSSARELKKQITNDIVDVIKSNKSKFFKVSENKLYFEGVAGSINKVELTNLGDEIAFLKDLGIEFKKSDIETKLTDNEKEEFDKAVKGIRTSIKEVTKIATIGGKTLSIEGHLTTLGELKAKIENPEFNTTYFNVKGERVQSFIGTNASSDLFDALSKVEKKSDLIGTPYEYLLNDVFSQNSVILNAIFNETGDRKTGSRQLMKTAYSDGIVDQLKNKQKSSSKLSYRDRLSQEINLNLKGYYANLVPGDASLGWMTYMGNHVKAKDLDKDGIGWRKTIPAIFKGYFIDELNLSRDDRDIVKLSEKQLKPGVKQRETRDLRFLKGILGDTLHKEILDLDTDFNVPAEDIYASFEKKINAAVEKFIKLEKDDLQETLEEYNLLVFNGESYDPSGLALADEMSQDELNKELNALSVNFIINNIELHKLLYSDPYQYADELKRIKSFNSPRQPIISDSPQMNAVMNKVWNEGYKPGDIGYTDFIADGFRSTTHADVLAISELPGYGTNYEETDGSGIIMMKANRNFRIRASDWNDNEERQYRYDVAWEKRYKKKSLSPSEQALLDAGNPEVKSAYTPIKPIVTGSEANGGKFNSIILDKFALYPLSFRMMKELNPTSNIVKLADKMQNENIDYIVFKSARKVGAKVLHETYNEEDGSFNNTPYSEEGIINIPFSIMSVQSEVPSKDSNDVTRGSQVTKLVTMDYMEAGVPIDFMPQEKDFAKRYKAWYDPKTDKNQSELYKEIKNNQSLLERLTDHGYQVLLKRLGISETITKTGDSKFVVTDKSKVTKTLRDEILKREVNSNISLALQSFLDGEAVLEATPAYQQIRNILYSIADKTVVSPKVNGGLKVQIPNTLLESVKAAKVNVNGKEGYESDYLDFYIDENGKRVCELMVARWFKSDKTDADLLEYFNKHPEGQKILSGLAFRIPTQKQNSIDSFVIKKFLPKEFGDSVVVPSALVKKVGSDFDIDKLSIYLKNLFVDKNGKLQLVNMKGSEQETKDYYGKEFDAILENVNNKKQGNLSDVLKMLSNQNIDQPLDTSDFETYTNNVDKLSKVLKNFDSNFEDVIDLLLERKKQLEASLTKLTDAELQAQLRDDYIDKKYKQALENDYIQSSQNLVSNELNFANLTKPNSSKQLEELSIEITKLRQAKEFDYTSTTNLLNRHFMTRLRHAFVTGKAAVGIAALAQTNHSGDQRQLTYIDLDKLRTDANLKEAHWLGDGQVKFDEVNRINVGGKMVVTLSMIKNEAGEFISDIIGQFIDGYVDISKGPWIMELGATPNVASTFLFLTRIGVPIRTTSMFMNQPIIRDYLRSIENAGYSYLFIDTIAEKIKDEYAPQSAVKATMIPSTDQLRDMIGNKDLSLDQRGDQRFILDEFLKYAKMAEQLFYVMQGSNFDTATFNDPFLVFKKEEQLKKAQQTIFSSVDTILANSFIGNTRKAWTNIRNAFSSILISDQPTARGVIEKTLRPYVDMSDRDFVKLAQKAVSNLFDWSIQTELGLNINISDILLSDTVNVADQVSEFIKTVKRDSKHPLFNNQVINLLAKPENKKAKANSVNNLYLTNRDNKISNQNEIIFSFHELKEHLKSVGNEKLYDRLIALSILQSGLTNSPISFTSLLPYEDFIRVYNKTLSALDQVPVSVFNKLNVFERENWNDDDIVPSVAARWTNTGKYNPDMKFLSSKIKDAVSKKVIPPVVTISTFNQATNKDVITYTWEKDQSEVLTAEDRKKGIKYKEKKAQMRREGDYSYINKGLFKKVTDDYGTPLLTSYMYNGKEYFSYVYKMINAWGDSYRASEYYNVAKPSVIDNGYLKVDREVDDKMIIPYFTTVKTAGKAVSSQPVAVTNTINIYAGTGENAELSNFAVRPFSIQNQTFNTVEGAFQAAKLAFTNEYLATGKLRAGDQELINKLRVASGAEAKRLGRGIQGLNSAEWDKVSLNRMKSFIKLSFEQNPDALAKLLATKDAELTHVQDTGKWGREFPKLLMEVRDEIKVIGNSIKLKC
jgi:predicted NAD-dependent protein-ADP-ribosyltransferase YbiA (DUF1768 family)